MNIDSLQDVANIISFIAPGYFALQTYSLVYAKKDRSFSRLLIESVVYSLPIVAFTGVLWRAMFDHEPSSLAVGYVALLIGAAVSIGLIVAFLRTHWPVKQLAQLMGLDSPNEDFVKTQLLRINARSRKSNAVTVQLKSGAVFSGTIDRMSRYNHDGPMYYCFANLAWFDESSGSWDERDGNIIVQRYEIEFIETKKLANT